MAKPVRPQNLLLISLALGWIFDFLFWQKAVGISLPIFTFLMVVIGLWMARRAGLKPSPGAVWLLAPIAFFSLVPALRLEPFTRLTSIILVFVLLAIFALSFLGGQWVRYGFMDYIAKILGLVPSGLGLLKETAGKETNQKGNRFSVRSLAPVFRGLLFALPLLWFLAVLLASADPAFADWLDSIFSFLEIDNAVEYVFRGFYILILAYGLAGVYMFAFNRSHKQVLLGEEKPIIAPVLGFGESTTMLSSVNILFAAFVVFQFNYFFGGTTNIVDTPTGFTYSEYAVRGFWELVAVSLTSLVFFIALSGISKRDTASQRRWFSGLGIALFALAAVILASAFERLLLYERVYGFTRLRTYPHVFMIWLGLLLLAIVILEALGRQRAFALATLSAAVGFSATLSLLNVDAFIVRQNIGLIHAGQQFSVSDPGSGSGKLDYAYLGTLSDDAVPALESAYRQSRLDEDSQLTQQLATTLTCHFKIVNQPGETPWQSWNRSRQAALSSWNFLKADPGFPIIEITEGNTFTFSGEELSCFGPAWD
ncbi:MAG TPA: DUF4173 domain-containing protein [Anaerolineales bacterium]|nr:DUF4173 domain-containing protein [Anaerolineales bacterium]